MEYFIVTKNVAKNSIIGYNKDLFFILFYCKELAKSVYFIWTKKFILYNNLCANLSSYIKTWVKTCPLFPGSWCVSCGLGQQGITTQNLTIWGIWG